MSYSLDTLWSRNQNIISSVSDEKSSGDGYWVYLRPGYVCDELHLIHENTIAAVKKKFAKIQKCHCEECTRLLA